MAILIKGMEMPKNCMECQLHELAIINATPVYFCKCLPSIKVIPIEEKRTDCPLVEAKHGRLIDADAEPSEVARDIATIIENEQDMRVMLKPERKGRWIQSSPFTKPRCSECGESCFGLHGFDYTVTNYCPNCGAKMREAEADDGNNDS